MEKQRTTESFISDIAAESDVRDTDPKEIRNWRVYVYCIGVCFGAVALGYVTSFMCVIKNMNQAYNLKVMMSL